MARSFYKEVNTLLVIPQRRGEEIRVSIGVKDNGTEYVDVRTWYPDDADEMQPGKGIAKPDQNGIWDAIAKAILDRNEIRASGKPRMYDPKKG